MKKLKLVALSILVSCALTSISAFSGPTSVPPPFTEQITASSQA